MSKIHWWELDSNCLLIVQKEGLDYLKSQRKRKKLTQKELDGKLSAAYVIQRYENGDRTPLKGKLIKILNLLNIDYQSFEKYIIGLTSWKLHDPVYISFPINERPEHIQMLAHGLFDGDETNGQIVYGCINDIEQKMFRKMVENAFGDVCIYYTRKRTAIPKCLAKLLKNHYQIKTLSSLEGCFSEYVENKIKQDEESRIRVIRAGFTDEGCVTVKNGITAFNSKNETLIQQMCDFLKIQGYSYWITKAPTETTVSIKSDSAIKFYNEIIHPLDGRYYKKKLAEKIARRTEKRLEKELEKQKMCEKIKEFIKNKGRADINEIYSFFSIDGSKKRKCFYDKFIRTLILKQIIYNDGKAIYTVR